MSTHAPTRLELPEGCFELRRYPARKRELLQAWCGADLLLLEAAREQGVQGEGVLVVNDEHGALSTVLSPLGMWTDSALSALALARNLARNERGPVPVTWSTRLPPGNPRLVLARIPKNLMYFEYQLVALQASVAPGTLLVFGGMDKHLSAHTGELVARIFGTVSRHPGSRKARLFSTVRDNSAPLPAPARPGYYCDPLEATLAGDANVFSARGLDIGTRFLLQQLHLIPKVPSAADLACGLGVLGLAALRAGVAQRMLFADESAMAVAASRDNYRSLFGARPGASFYHGDGLYGIDAQFDLILCNPPFHLGHTVDDFAGKRLIRQAAQHVAPGGHFCLVANRHLAYEPALRRHFASVEKLAGNRKFTVWIAGGGCQAS
jgi:16S rRNA G1207 methylase RsmC